MSQEVIGRRTFLGLAGAGALIITLEPLTAHATPEAVTEAIRKLIGDKNPVEDRVSLSVPHIAENGSVVPMSVSVESPMTAHDHVKAIHILADGNPLPDVATYRFGPHNGKAEFSLRIRLMKTQNIVAVAEMSDGRTFIDRKAVKVTLGGCGG